MDWLNTVAVNQQPPEKDQNRTESQPKQRGSPSYANWVFCHLRHHFYFALINRAPVFSFARHPT